MDSIKNTVNQATEKVQEGLSGTSKEANKEVAKDSNAGIGTRASAAKDAASDKVRYKSNQPGMSAIESWTGAQEMVEEINQEKRKSLTFPQIDESTHGAKSEAYKQNP
ncbi:unnamed protein product [Fusarium graminearum]|uniref:Chromosome 4, complete genome n=1 Tax=Gibberella zeae (strain ATCC MYA-4620 / CBS 123657 / FGSC 9075 / NRRL 31084 / PH-1) TaxID=229533 RepID=A0A1C3YL91_GIBZE|nr:hypothetical protein HG531_004054 [Fusarium graminearum]CAF3462151.1 unnamed protein product [Fusarium graminearum]CAG1972377.1 unnamed protein product [Fusarium graminearum]CAG1984962.1 unnamed protein product [Fusarium graminearum]SCB65198.1 unnamed protein product [Fusarium graminearum]